MIKRPNNRDVNIVIWFVTNKRKKRSMLERIPETSKQWNIKIFQQNPAKKSGKINKI